MKISLIFLSYIYVVSAAAVKSKPNIFGDSKLIAERNGNPVVAVQKVDLDMNVVVVNGRAHSATTGGSTAGSTTIGGSTTTGGASTTTTGSSTTVWRGSTTAPALVTSAATVRRGQETTTSYQYAIWGNGST